MDRSAVQSDIDRILVSREAIAARVRAMGDEISRDLAHLVEAGDEIVLVPILVGSMIFVADLIRHLPQKIRISVVTVSSYPGTATRSQGVRIEGSLPDDLAAKHVLIVDDILDSGRTISRIRAELEARGPRSLRACVLLRKRVPAALAVECEYVGFDIPDEFVVGYGLDYDNYYRNLPEIGVLKREAM